MPRGPLSFHPLRRCLRPRPAFARATAGRLRAAPCRAAAVSAAETYGRPRVIPQIGTLLRCGTSCARDGRSPFRTAGLLTRSKTHTPFAAAQTSRGPEPCGRAMVRPLSTANRPFRTAGLPTRSQRHARLAAAQDEPRSQPLRAGDGPTTHDREQALPDRVPQPRIRVKTALLPHGRGCPTLVACK